jgi:Thiamine pyrophosphate enzyme, C-terminal TPP binding domain
MYKIWFARNYRTPVSNTLLLDNALATMGAGLPSAMMAAIRYPGRRVLAVCGDGGFMMNSQELETAVRLGLNLVVLILQDDAYGMIRWKQAVDKFTWWSYRSTTQKTQGFSSTNFNTASPLGAARSNNASPQIRNSNPHRRIQMTSLTASPATSRCRPYRPYNRRRRAWHGMAMRALTLRTTGHRAPASSPSPTPGRSRPPRPSRTSGGTAITSS